MGIWKEIRKSINSDLNTPLNTLINNVKEAIDSVNTNISNVKYSISNVKDTTSSINNSVSNVKDTTNSINTNVSNVKIDISLITSSVATNNTPNTSGNLSQKLAWLISTWTSAKAGCLDDSISSRQSEANASSRYNNIYNKLTPAVPSVGSGSTVVYSGSVNSITPSVCVAKFIAPVSGLYTLTSTSAGSTSKATFAIPRIRCNNLSSNSSTTQYIISGEALSYNGSTVGQAIQGGIFDGEYTFLTSDKAHIISDGIGLHRDKTSTNVFYCTAGEPVTIFVDWGANPSFFESIVVTCQTR